MAVPGNVLSGRSAGGHALIRDGAGIVETAGDVLEAIGFGPPAGAPPPAESAAAADPVLRHMDPGETWSVDELIERSGLDSAAVSLRLTELELAGAVIRVGAGRFVRPAPGMLV